MTTEQQILEQQQYPEKFFDKADYTFSKAELTIINQYQTIQKMGEMAALLIKDLVNKVCLPRTGNDPNKQIGIYYNLGEGTFSVYSPRHWCAMCKHNAGVMMFENEHYCEKDFELAKLKADVVSEKNGKDTSA